MATSTLLLTVGGTSDPLVIAVEQLRPDHLVFFCTVDPQTTVPTTEEVLDRTSFEGTSEIVAVDADDLGGSVAVMIETIGRLAAEGCELDADYTGGTKTMSSALVMAGTLSGVVELHLTTGLRTDTRKVTMPSSTRAVKTAELKVRLALRSVLPGVLERDAYGEAAALVRDLIGGNPLDQETLNVLEPLRVSCEGFDAWDRFDHERAAELLRPLFGVLGRDDLARSLAGAQRCRDVLGGDPQRHHNYDLVGDLLANAGRRAAAGRFDDAVGRLYRALEMAAQLRWLQQYGIETSAFPDVDGSFRPVGLRDAWSALAERGDVMGVSWREWETRLLDFVQHRNKSLYAHGVTPVDSEQWERMWATVSGFLDAALAEERLTPHLGLPGRTLLDVWSV